MRLTFAVGRGRECKDVSRRLIVKVCHPYVRKWGPEDTAYISLAGTQYVDSDLFHEELDIPYSNMASAENGTYGRDGYEGWVPRYWARFSKPSKEFQLVEDFDDIEVADLPRSRIVWYDSVNTSEVVLRDAVPSVMRMIKRGSLIFFTFIETPRSRQTPVMKNRARDMEGKFYETPEGIFSRFCMKVHEEACGYGLKVLEAHTYESARAMAVYVIGFEVVEKEGLDMNDVSLQSIDGSKDCATDPWLTDREVERLSLVLKRYKERGGSKIRWKSLCGIDAYGEEFPLGIPVIGRDSEIIATAQLEVFAEAIDEDDEERIMADFPEEFLHHIAPIEEPIGMRPVEKALRTVTALKGQLEEISAENSSESELKKFVASVTGIKKHIDTFAMRVLRERGNSHDTGSNGNNGKTLWAEVVAEALDELGGFGITKEIMDGVKKNRRAKDYADTFKKKYGKEYNYYGAVNSILRTNTDLFTKVDRGLWKLNRYREPGVKEGED